MMSWIFIFLISRDRHIITINIKLQNYVHDMIRLNKKLIYYISSTVKVWEMGIFTNCCYKLGNSAAEDLTVSIHAKNVHSVWSFI